MNNKEVYEAWAPRNAPWSQWVSPVAFAAIGPQAPAVAVAAASYRSALRAELIEPPAMNTAVVLDVPGPEAVKTAVQLARHGFQPVPIFNASPGPGPRFPGDTEQRPIVDLTRVTRELLAALPEMTACEFPAAAPPAFAIDANRMSARPVGEPNRFDNRWIVYAADFPSAAKLRDHGITRVVAVQEGSSIAQDLKDVLLEWQLGGLEIFTRLNRLTARDVRVQLRAPSKLALLWRRLLRALGFKTNSDFWDYMNSRSGGGG